MRIALILIGFLLLLCPMASQAQDVGVTDSGGPLLYEQAAYDVTFYDLAIRIEPEQQAISGAATVHARIVQPISWFVLDLDTVFTVESVHVFSGGQAGEAHIERRGGKLWTRLARTYQPGEQVQVRVQYRGRPRVAQDPPWGGGFTWAETEDGRSWIATSLQGEGADLWWPCKDHPSDEADSVAAHFEVPGELLVASNGTLRGVTDNPGGTKTYHWFVSTPINNYAVALNAAPYRVIEDVYRSTGGELVPVSFWVLPERYEDAQRLYPQILEHLAFYEKYLGPYPFRADKYGVAHTPFLGMEHQTIIAYGSNFSNQDDGYDWLHHHELAHEWWGNLVTAYDWRDFWLHEGLGTYMQALYTQELFGDAAYREDIAEYRSYLLNLKPVAPREVTTTDEIYFVAGENGGANNDIYYKGAAILHTLRYVIGDEDFFTLLRRFAYPTPELERVTDGSHTRFVTTDDFLHLAEEISGMELDWFFEVYLRQPELPTLVHERSGNDLVLRWEVPGNLPFPMPVDVQIGNEVLRVEIPNGQAVLSGAGTANAVVDPMGWVLRAGQ
jgi:aminopeptidase N